MLTTAAIKAAQPKERKYKLYDEKGLFLEFTPSGGKLWRFRYKIGGKEKLLALGAYPEVSLLKARAARDEARQALVKGIDPSLDRKVRRAKATNSDLTFEAMARAWHALRRPAWSQQHGVQVLDSLEKNVFPALGKIPIDDITAPMLLPVLRKIENRAPETAHRVRQRISEVYVYAISQGHATINPAAMLDRAMAPVVKGRQPAITDLDEVKKLLREAEAIPAHPATKLAMRLLALTAVRPGNVAGALWHEFEGLDGKEPLWRIPAERMKMKREHVVPLASQAVAVIEAVRALTGRFPFVFPNTRHAHKPMSENAMGYLLNRAGYHGRHVPHGWRSSFSTIMNELYRADRQIIDLMLAHSPSDATEAAYNRAAHMGRRRELAQEWADLLLVGAVEPTELLHGPRR